MVWKDPVLYQWDSSLETGYGKIDSQHKQLFEMVNKLIAAGSSGKGGDVVMEALDFLARYVIKHFSDEEQLQIDYEYPDYIDHKRKHDEFKVVVGELVQRLKTEGITEDLMEVVCNTIGSWLLEHIKGDDFRMASFVKDADNASKSAVGK